jgi:N-acetylneuraminic acid mutarotase
MNIIKQIIVFSFCICFLYPHAQNWIKLDSITGPGRAAPFAFSLNGKIYVGGGENAGSATNSFYEFDFPSNSWTPKTNLPAIVQGAAYFSLSGKGYVVTGVNDVALVSTVYQYDQILNQWNTMSDFPGPARQCFWFCHWRYGIYFWRFPWGLRAFRT